MEINLILRVAGIGLMVSATALILNKSGRDEQGTMVVIAGFIAVFLLIIGEMDELLDIIKDVFEI